MNPLRSVFSLTSFALLSTAIGLGGCTFDGLDEISLGDSTSDLDTCVAECRANANQCGYDDTCEKACALLDEADCLEETHALQSCKEDGADRCHAPQCQAEAEAAFACTHGFCEANPTAEGC